MTRSQQEYIANMLRHASHKKYENYALGQIFWKLEARGIVLEFRTQQTVFRKNAERHVAYMDGYIPSLNVQFEVDEPYHKHQAEADKRRENDVKEVLRAMGALHLKAKPTVIRIDISKDDIDEQCNKAVEKVAALYAKAGKPAWKETDNAETIKQQHCIKYSDSMMFKRKNVLVNAMGFRTRAGEEYKSTGTESISVLHLNDAEDIWFPCISDNAATGWKNNYNFDTNVFTSHCTNFKRNAGWQRDEKLYKEGKMKLRYIFFKAVDAFNNLGYVYFGKYKCIGFDAKTQTETWQRISVEDLKFN